MYFKKQPIIALISKMISIITPTFNGKEFIERCILNVIDQDCIDIEHIIVDGGSADGTQEIIKSYAADHSHIKWLSEKDSGQSSAMNKGVRLAKGEIISFLNVDDFYTRGLLKRVQSVIAVKTPPIFIVGNCSLWNKNGGMVGINCPNKPGLTDLLAGFAFPCNPSAYFYSKSLHDLVGYYNEDEHYTMDLDFILKVAAKVPLLYFNEPWGNMLIDEGTKTFSTIKDGSLRVRVQKYLDLAASSLPLYLRGWIKVKKYFHFQLRPFLNIGRVKKIPKAILKLLKSI